jgi:hypothetical protein
MKLTDTQTQILAAAAAHLDRLALPPERLPAAPRQAVGKALLKAGLVAAVAEPAAEAGAGWTIEGESLVLRVTDAGLAAIGAGEAATVEEAQEGPQAGAEGAGVDLRSGGAQEGQEAVSGPARAAATASRRQSLRDAATAVLTAWDGSANRAGLEEAIAALRSVLAGKAPHRPGRSGGARTLREGTKQERVLALLRRPEGATVAQIAEATGWQHHTVRGFFAGLKKRQGITVEAAERVRQVGAEGAKGSYTVYRIADAG